MKKLALLFTIFLSVGCFAQSENNEIHLQPPPAAQPEITTKKDVDDVIFQKVEIESEFPGGNKAFSEFLMKHLKASVPSDKKAPKGKYTVVIKFIVDKTGNLSSIFSETNPGYGTEAEAIRVMKLSPKWKPAVQNGVVVNSVKRQPITFVVE